uniref:Arf-GAP with SH3 domain, ANK repeat and PH domain-containing protein 1 n=1 Tax=Schistocephalus solidus TaxID=70667 RepID=A0A0X3NVM2_SCHSO
MTEPVAVDEFIHDTLEDIKSPTKSEFSSKIPQVRFTVHSLDEGLEADKSVLSKSRKIIKNVVSTGIGYADATLSLCDHLEKLGQFALEPIEGNGSDLAAGLCQFSVIHRDLANMFRHLMQNLNSILVFPMETFLQSELKSDLKKPFEKALKDYEYKYEKLRKEKIQAMKESGVYMPDVFTAEMAEDLEKERRRLQLEVCEYLIKVNEVKSKKGADFLQHFIDFYRAHLHYLKECVCVMEHFGKSMPDLANRISLLQRQHDAQKRRLVDTRENVRRLLEKESNSTSTAMPAQPLQINPAYGTRKSGFLLKKSDGKVKRVWQRRRVCITDTEFCLYHADEAKPPVKLMLLTCQLKFPPGEGPSAVGAPTSNGPTPGAHTAGANADSADAPTTASHASQDPKRSFYLVSNNRTYQFQAEDERDFDEWTNVLSNAMQAVFNQALNGDESGTKISLEGSSGLQRNSNSPQTTGGIGGGLYDSQYSHNRFGANRMSQGSSLTGSEGDLLDSPNLTAARTANGHNSDIVTTCLSDATECNLKGRALHQAIQSIMRRQVPGNEVCADCGRPDPEWVSVNLGVLICLECCGTHRELGVQCSRTQSLLMDDLSTSQLLLPRFIGNRTFNEVYESSLADGIKPKPSDSTSDTMVMKKRRAFIRSKYVERRFITSTTGGTVGRQSKARSSLGRRASLEPVRVSGNDTTAAAAVTRETIISDPDRFLRRDLLRATRTGDLATLLQVHAEGFDLNSRLLPSDDPDVGESGDTVLHLAIQASVAAPTNYHGGGGRYSPVNGLTGLSPENKMVQSFHAMSSQPCALPSRNCLPLIEFIIQNSPLASIQRTNNQGDTVLHYAARFASPDAVRLLLNVGGLPSPMLLQKNNAGETPLETANTQLSDLSLRDLEPEGVPTAALEARLQQCISLLELAETVQNLSRDGADKTALLFNSSASADADSAAAKLQLVEAIDDLQSVNWAPDSAAATASPARSFSPACTMSKPTSVVRRTSDVLCKLFDRSFGSTGLDMPEGVPKSTTSARVNSPYSASSPFSQSFKGSSATKLGSVLATLPRKKGPAPRPPSFRHDSTSVNASSAWFSLSTDSCGSGQRSLSEYSESTPPSRRFSSSGGTDLPPGYAVASSRHLASSTPLSANRNSSRSAKQAGDVASAPHQSSDHIDVLLDVLEEDPTPERLLDPATGRPYPATISRISARAASEGVVLAQNPPLSEEDDDDDDCSCLELLPTSIPNDVNPDRPREQPRRPTTTPRAVSSTSHCPAPPPDPIPRRCRALYDCEAENADELTFRKDEVICIVKSVEPDWWEGYIEDSPSRRGLFPVPYVKLLPTPK